MTWARDIRLAIRLLVKDRWFTVAAAVTLALGISVNTMVFTLADAVLFRAIPFSDPDGIVLITMRDDRNRELGVSFLDMRDWRERSTSFSSMALMAQMPFNVADEGQAPDRYSGAPVSSAFFTIVGANPLLGRVLTTEDDQNLMSAVMVIGHGMWQTRYGGDPGVIGRTVRVNDMPATIVGVMRPGMQFPPNTDLWMPLERSPFTRRQARDGRVFQVLARLADGVTIEQAQSEMNAIVARMADEFPQTNRGVSPVLSRYQERVLGPRIKLVFLALLGAVGFVLLIACANVANLQLSRAVDRAREVSIRLSLGSTRWQVVRQFMVESVLLALFGSLLGLPLSIAGVRLFDDATHNVGKPFWMTFAFDERVFVFFFVVCVLTGVIFGVAPAWHVSRTNVNDVLKEGGRSGSGGLRARRWAGTLLVAEVAFTVVLLSSAGFMIRSFLAIYRLDLGIDTSRLLVMQLTMTDRKYPTQYSKREFTRRLDDRLTAIPAIEAATTASFWPLGGGFEYQLHVDGRPPADAPPMVTMISVGRRYFETLGIRLTQGRTFTDLDSEIGREGAIVNERFAALHFPGEDPIGRRVRLVEADGLSGVRLPTLTIVGIVDNVLQRVTPSLVPDAIVYVHDLANPTVGRPTALLVRSRSEQPGHIAQILRDEVRALDDAIPVVNIQTMEQSLAQARWTYRVFGLMFSAFAAIALVLAAVGLYAVTAYSVTQRTQEIGVRTALGAQPSQVMWLFFRQSMAYVGVGVAIGVAGALGVGQLIETLLVSTSPRDGVTIASIVAVTIVVSVLACVWPAHRAARLDPLVALRNE